MSDRRTNPTCPMTRLASVLVLIGFLWGVLIGGTQLSVHAEPVGDRTAAEPILSADSLLLDQYPDAYAAYSLRRLRSDYSGSVVRVRRTSDGSEKDIGFTSEGWIDTTAISNFVGSGDGYVTRWYSQVAGSQDLTQPSQGSQPRIAQGGTPETDEEGKPTIYFSETDDLTATGFSSDINLNSFSFFGLINTLKDYGENERTGFGLWYTENNGTYGFQQTRVNGNFDRLSSPDTDKVRKYDRGYISVKNDGNRAALHQDWRLGETTESDGLSDSTPVNSVHVNGELTGAGGFEGHFGEFVVFDRGMPDSEVEEIYLNATADWAIGPSNWYKSALLPQNNQWQVDLYEWMLGLTQSDVELPSGTISWDGTYSDIDELADIWLKTRKATASSVIRSEWEWYTLDAGNGKGIEATGDVRIQHEPDGSKSPYQGNPARSWGNEPAWLYQLDIPTNGGSGQGNDWYKDPNLGRRAMVVTAVDLMMRGTTGRADMMLRQFLGYAEAYRNAGEVLPSGVRDAFERAFSDYLDEIIKEGPTAVNTNLDMFGFQGMVDLYFAADSSSLQQKCVEAAKRMLFGYTDGQLETNHKLFAEGPNRYGGVFDPSGAVLEGGQPVFFYGGESMNSIAKAFAVATDRSTGALASDWQFLEEILKRAQEFRTFQQFPLLDKGDSRNVTRQQGGVGYDGRTSKIGQQGSHTWKHLVIADGLQDPHKWVMKNMSYVVSQDVMPSESEMQTEINNNLNYMDGELDSTYTGTPNQWNGWTAWPKFTPYLPEEGWYSRLKTLEDNNDPKEKPPALRDGYTWNKALGGPPEGKSFWSYKDTDSNGKAYGFFIEAMPKQGVYGGWYGGKIETFWTEDAGIVWQSGRGKSGCDRTGVDDYSNSEDSQCWFNLDEKAGQHVWGRDENGDGFSSLFPRGRESDRTTSYDTDGSPPTVSVTTQLNDASYERDGLENDGVLDGNLEITNTFEVTADGVKTTHSLTSDNSDEITELWASIPAYLKHHNKHRPDIGEQADMNDATLEYWDGASWTEIPYDQNNDGIPEIVTAEALRFGHDYNDGNGLQWAYVDFENPQDIRRSKHIYYDPYQSHTKVRTIHIDLHGDPGTTKTMPAGKSVSYTIQTTDPTSEGGTSTSQVISLQKGWNIASTSISPAAPAMDSVFAGLQSKVTVVKNEAGERYRPSEDLNEIGQWNSEEAYLIHLTSDTNLSIEGDSLGSPSISLEEGWNLIPYFPASSLSVEDALSSITEDLVLLKDETGRSYLPGEGIESLNQMEPGEGYKLYVQQPVTLTYPDGGN